MKLALFLGCLAPALLLAGQGSSAAPTTGYLKVKAPHSDAGVSVDGGYVGPASRKYPLTPGKHVITVTDPRYEDAAETIQIEAGKTKTLDEQTMKPKVAPTPPFGTLHFRSTNKWAAVLVNDEYVGYADQFRGGMHGLLVPPGTYRVELDGFGGDALLVQDGVAVVAGKDTPPITQGATQ